MSLRLNFQKEEFVLRDSFLFFPGEINLLIIYFYDRESAPSVPSDLLFAEKRHVPQRVVECEGPNFVRVLLYLLESQSVFCEACIIICFYQKLLSSLFCKIFWSLRQPCANLARLSYSQKFILAKEFLADFQNSSLSWLSLSSSQIQFYIGDVNELEFITMLLKSKIAQLRFQKQQLKLAMIELRRLSSSSCSSILKFSFSHKDQKRKFFKIQDQRPSQQIQIVKPQQYPKNLNDISMMVSRDRPKQYLTPKHETPQDKLMFHDDMVVKQKYNNQWKSPQNSYVLNIGLIGPVNSGKSQLLSKLSHKVSAVSPKSNTTTQIMQAIKSQAVHTQQGLKNIQLKYFDTPGMMYVKTGFVSKGWRVLADIDFSLLVIDSAKRCDDIIQESIKRLQKHRNYQNFMKALVLNKVDLVDNKRKFHSLIAQVQKYGKFDKVFYTSAKTGYGISELEQYLLSMAKKGEWQHPKEAMTTSSEIEIIQEMLRQALFHRSYKQVPHKLLLQCVSFASKSDNTDQIHFRVIVEDENQQRMILGKKGQNIQWAIENLKVSYAKFFKKELSAFVKVVYRKNYMGREELDFQNSQYEMQNKQKIRVAEEYFYATDKFIK